VLAPTHLGTKSSTLQMPHHTTLGKETLKSLASKIDLKNQRVFCRVDFNGTSYWSGVMRIYVRSLPTLTASPLPLSPVTVPLDKEAKVTDDTRIRAALPTIKFLVVRTSPQCWLFGLHVMVSSRKGILCPACARLFSSSSGVSNQSTVNALLVGLFNYLEYLTRDLPLPRVANPGQEKGARVVLCSHLGRPKGVTESLRMAPVATRLSELMGSEVKYVKDCVGEEVEQQVEALSAGQVLLLENVRFYKEEEKNAPEFAAKLARLADVYVNDAFGTAHRAHASTEGIAKLVKTTCAGFLMEKELSYLDGAVSKPTRPFAAIVGGSKVRTRGKRWRLIRRSEGVWCYSWRVWANIECRRLVCSAFLSLRGSPRRWVADASYCDANLDLREMHLVIGHC